MATSPQLPSPGAIENKNHNAACLAAPRSVKAAAILLAVAGAVQVLASVIAVIYALSPERLTVIREQIDALSGSVSSLESVRNMGVITVVLAGLGTLAAYVLLAFFICKGRAWARTGAAVLIALTLVQLLGISYPLGLTTVAQLCLGGVAVALCYFPAGTRYFAATKASGRKSSPLR